MQLPRVKIQFLTGQLGTVGDSPDGLFALVCGAAAVGSAFTLNTAYEVTSMDSVQALGLTGKTMRCCGNICRSFMTRQVPA